MAEARQPCRLELGRNGALALVEGESALSGWQGETFHLPLDPPLRVVIAGHGEEVPALAGLARAWGAQLLVLTPDERTAAASGAESILLRTTGPHPALVLDRWSALIMLFHDHDWELALLRQALDQEALFIGAMGSKRTHANRLSALEQAGVSPQLAARIHGPIGLIPAARDPQTLALSVLSEVVACWQGRTSECKS
jgi:xanthine dehydrogenase accessory factor